MSKIKYVDRKRIIDINKLIITIWNERHPEKPEFIDVGTDRIDEVLRVVEDSANDLTFDKSLIEKAAYLVGGLAWCQAFSGANKRTAISTCAVFLLQNGYRLTIQANENPELRQLLFDVQEKRGEINREVIDKIILYISNHVKKT